MKFRITALRGRGVAGGFLDLAELELNQYHEVSHGGGGHAAEEREVDFEETVGRDLDGLVDDLQGELADLGERISQLRSSWGISLPERSAGRC
jgi:hypothetical protein